MVRVKKTFKYNSIKSITLVKIKHSWLLGPVVQTLASLVFPTVIFAVQKFNCPTSQRRSTFTL